MVPVEGTTKHHSRWNYRWYISVSPEYGNKANSHIRTLMGNTVAHLIDSNIDKGSNVRGSHTDSNAQSARTKHVTISQENTLFANAPIIKSFLKKAARNVHSKSQNDPMSNARAEVGQVGGADDKNACDTPSCQLNDSQYASGMAGQQVHGENDSIRYGIAAKVTNVEGTFAEQGEDPLKEQSKGNRTGHGVSASFGEAARGNVANNQNVRNVDEQMPNVNVNIEGLGNEKVAMGASSQVLINLQHANGSISAGNNPSNQHGHAMNERAGTNDNGKDSNGDSAQPAPKLSYASMFQSLQFTWNQKPRGTDGKLKKIDRIMANLAFTDAFIGAHAIFQPYRISDHSPAILTIPTSHKFTPRPFKFYNIIVQNSQFKGKVKEFWDMDVSGFHMYKVLGNGSKALAWFDSWCLLSPLANIVSSRDFHRAGFGPTTTVRDIITPIGWAWPGDWVIRYCLFAGMIVMGCVMSMFVSGLWERWKLDLAVSSLVPIGDYVGWILGFLLLLVGSVTFTGFKIPLGFIPKVAKIVDEAEIANFMDENRRSKVSEVETDEQVAFSLQEKEKKIAHGELMQAIIDADEVLQARVAKLYKDKTLTNDDRVQRLADLINARSEEVELADLINTRSEEVALRAL
ncbi:reverse transcriptase domain, Reverse transcriptase zinc-binding domain protein [Artemisia annua]|uniref:Reverse transcriptase domain, Reverse transcriptase zinc-binding domain protein n=1 Tax=Artemisia annua TaxID=35608 RepID=A0A2U1PVQ5_ARTAN|nr:reverse transcriptase domain, Reverse transcriptase zinc-binding domain protein [Artemisia annua]